MNNMKRLLLNFVLLTISTIVYAQDQDKDFERKNYYELTGRANFYEVNNRYQILKDTIFYSTTGFLINTDWEEVSIENKIYIVVTYPNYKNGQQRKSNRSVSQGLTENDPVRHPIETKNGKILCILKEDFEKIEKKPLYSINFKKIRNYQITAGQLTLPFKLRPKQGEENFQMTTDVTVGAYGGIRKRISKYSPTYITIPAVLGLSFINVNENTTTNVGTADIKSGITPGWTWATGIVIQTNRLTLGFVFGRDYASGYADDWIYHNKTWYSFAIGYSFLK
jgi:hypothetical protein